MNSTWTSIDPQNLFSQHPPGNVVSRIFHYPLLRVLVIVMYLAPVLIINSVVVTQVIANAQEPLASYIDMARMLITLPLLILSYRLYCRTFEKRDAVEFGLSGSLRQWSLGAVTATALVFIIVLTIAAVGEFNVIEFRSGQQLLNNFLTFITGALFQEIILLCVVYRLIEELSGTWISLFISIALFSGVHLLNPNENLGSVMMLMLSSLIFIAPFILTRRIWVSWGLHAGWNFMQAGIFGLPNSGIVFKGWMVTELEGPLWLTGGAVGLEASYLSVGLDLLIGLVVLRIAYNAGKFVAPLNHRKVS
jgi:membrane protease YdiL (CAAX protease family)